MRCLRPALLLRIVALVAVLLPASVGSAAGRGTDAFEESRVAATSGDRGSLSPRVDPELLETVAASREETLTLDECVQIALAANPSSRAARYGVAAAQEAVGEAAAPYLPEVSLRAGYDRFRSHAFFPSGLSRPGLSSTIGPTDDWSAAMRARLLVFDSGRRESQLAAARARRNASQREADSVRESLALGVHEAFYRLLAAEETEGVGEKNLARAQDHRRLASERKAAGAVPQADVVRADVEVADARLALVRLRNVVRVARGSLNTLLGRPVEAQTRIEGESEPAPPPEAFDLQQALDRAARARPDLQAALRRVEASQSAVSTAKSGHGPKVLAEGGYGWRDDRFPPRDEEWSAGISLEITLFSGLSTTHAVERTRADLAREEAEAARQLLEVRQDVWVAHSGVREAYEAIQAAETLVVQARESMRLAQERYRAGAGTATDLLDAQTTLARAEAAQAEARWNYRIAVARFRWAGEGLTAAWGP